MERDISQSSQTVNSKIQDNFKGLLETLSDHLQQEKNLNTHSQSTQPLVCTSAKKQSAHSSEPLSLSVIAATDLSSLSESSIDSSNMSINSVGYVADTSSTHPQGKIESPVKNPPCQPGQYVHVCVYMCISHMGSITVTISSIIYYQFTTNIYTHYTVPPNS